MPIELAYLRGRTGRKSNLFTKQRLQALTMSNFSFIACDSIDVIAGYMHGMTQPSLSARLLLSNSQKTTGINRQLARLLEPYIPPEHLSEIEEKQESDSNTLAETIGNAVGGLQESAGIPVLNSAKVISCTQDGSKAVGSPEVVVTVLFPSLVPLAAKLVLEWLLSVVNNLRPEQSELSAKQSKKLDQLFQRLNILAPGGSNNIRFIRAADTLGIPVIALPGGVFQYGWGKRGRWFNSSITDETPFIAVKYAKNKLLTTSTLKSAGIPVPEGNRVKSMTEAASLADRIGFPVVVKPADLDQGKGVHADLRTENEVYAAFKQASKLSTSIMLERHHKGHAFRITLFRGESVAIVKRLPAGVTGDGIATVNELIEKTNTDPRRSSSRFSIMKPITVDEEARLLLQQDGLRLDSVPQKGQFVALKKAANVSTGGDAILLEKDDIHPSYLSLVKRAAALLRLDIAAVDFITDDIEKSWQESDAVIIEVNAQPQMGTILTHLHGQLLGSYVKRRGRIPSMLVLGADRGDVVKEVREYNGRDLSGLGCVSKDGIFIGRERIGDGGKNSIAEARTLLINPSVAGLLLAGELEAIAANGHALPFIEKIVISSWPDEWEKTPKEMELLSSQLDGEIWLVKDHPLESSALQMFSRENVRVFESRDSMIEASVEILSEECND